MQYVSSVGNISIHKMAAILPPDCISYHHRTDPWQIVLTSLLRMSLNSLRK